jgi:uncharacterized protein YheU (UPF0270 family)
MNVVVPYDSLRAPTLRAVIEEFITRNGAIHGHTDTPLDRQVEAVQAQLKSGRAMIVFDDETGNCSIFLAKDWKKATPEQRGDEPKENADGADER